MADIITDYTNKSIRQADNIRDELDEFMKKLEDAGLLSGWSQFVNGEDTDKRQEVKQDD